MVLHVMHAHDYVAMYLHIYIPLAHAYIYTCSLIKEALLSTRSCKVYAVEMSVQLIIVLLSTYISLAG